VDQLEEQCVELKWRKGKTDGKKLTFDHFPGIVDDALVVLVRSMRKVHAN